MVFWKLPFHSSRWMPGPTSSRQGGGRTSVATEVIFGEGLRGGLPIKMKPQKVEKCIYFWKNAMGFSGDYISFYAGVWSVFFWEKKRLFWVLLSKNKGGMCDKTAPINTHYLVEKIDKQRDNKNHWNHVSRLQVTSSVVCFCLDAEKVWLDFFHLFNSIHKIPVGFSWIACDNLICSELSYVYVYTTGSSVVV